MRYATPEALRRSPSSILDALRDAAEIDLGDHFTFRIEESRRTMPKNAPYGGVRLTMHVTYTLALAAERRWLRLKGSDLPKDVIQDVKVIDGIREDKRATS